MKHETAMYWQENCAKARPKDRRFNFFRVAKTLQAQGCVAEIRLHLGNLETFDCTRGGATARQRARRQEDKGRFDRQVEALASGLIHQHLRHPDVPSRLSRSKSVLGRRPDRYAPRFLSEKLVQVMDMMARPEMGYCEVELGMWGSGQTKGRQTRIWPGVRLISAAQRWQLTLDDFGLDEDEEVLVLKATKTGRGDKPRWLDYDDTPKTCEMRLEMKRINRALEEARIEYRGHRDVDVQQRRLKRLFNNGSFDQHGRLYGGFWTDLPSQERLADLRLNGSPVAGLDFGQMSMRLLYATASQRPHFQDAYAVPGLAANRAGVKKMLNAMIASSKPLKRFPKGVNRLFPKKIVRNGEEVRLKVADVLELIGEVHAPVREQFYRARALGLMFMESQIMVQVLLRLVDLGITALPVHDGLVVAEEHALVARDVMHSCFIEFTGFPGVVTLESRGSFFGARLGGPLEGEGLEGEEDEDELIHE